MSLQSLMKLMKLVLNLTFCLLLFGCSTPVKEPKKNNAHRYEKYTGKIEKKSLAVESDWIGGSLSNPIFYTLKAERIYTLGEDVYSYPVTYLSVNSRGQVVYPDSGVALVGDVSVEHYISLLKAAWPYIQKEKMNFPLQVKGDSNFLKLPFEVSSYGKTSKNIRFRYKFGKWVKE